MAYCCVRVVQTMQVWMKSWSEWIVYLMSKSRDEIWVPIGLNYGGDGNDATLQSPKMWDGIYVYSVVDGGVVRLGDAVGLPKASCAVVRWGYGLMAKEGEDEGIDLEILETCELARISVPSSVPRKRNSSSSLSRTSGSSLDKPLEARKVEAKGPREMKIACISSKVLSECEPDRLGLLHSPQTRLRG